MPPMWLDQRARLGGREADKQLGRPGKGPVIEYIVESMPQGTSTSHGKEKKNVS